MNVIYHGFPPVYDENSKILILGSFPSVKSREISFYYGNKQNRFWKMLFEYFHVKADTVEEKIAFLKEKGIALWDIVTACTIVGSQDATLKAVELANLDEILEVAKIKAILLNGTKAYELFMERYGSLQIPVYKMSSTSPANPRYKQETWWNVLSKIL